MPLESRHWRGDRLQSPAMNACATGARRNRALVAVGSGLLEGMDSAEVQAVLGREMT